MEIPLDQAGRPAGILRLRRRLDQQALLFRLSSLLELISGAFCARLAALADEQHTVQATDVEPAGLRAARTAAAGSPR
jgi:hypothetical protein